MEGKSFRTYGTKNFPQRNKEWAKTIWVRSPREVKNSQEFLKNVRNKVIAVVIKTGSQKSLYSAF